MASASGQSQFQDFSSSVILCAIVLMSTFSWHGPTPSWLSLAFIIDWRVLSLGCLALTKLCPLGRHLAQQMALHFCSICWVDEIKTNNTELLTYFIKKRICQIIFCRVLTKVHFQNPKLLLKSLFAFMIAFNCTAIIKKCDSHYGTKNKSHEPPRMS